MEWIGFLQGALGLIIGILIGIAYSSDLLKEANSDLEKALKRHKEVNAMLEMIRREK